MSEDSHTIYESERRRAEANKAARIVQRMRHYFGTNGWKQDDNFLDKFFPICPTWKPHIEAAQKRNYNARTSRWKRILKNPRAASDLYTPLRMLMNDILRAEEASRQPLSSQGKGKRQKTTQRSAHRYEWRTRHIRTVLATHAKNKRVYTHPPSPVSPALYLAGGGSQIMGIGEPLIQANGVAGIAPIEVMLDSDGDPLVARDRLATNVSQMFCNQSSRRFAFGLIMTETTCTAYMFDHSGGVASQPFNYHQQPAQFCAIIFRLGCDQSDRLGFDPSVFLERSRGGFVIRTLVDSEEESANPVFYIRNLDGELFRFSTLIGRGTVCWRAWKDGHPGSLYVIKEAWVSCDDPELPGKESEGSLLRHAQEKGVVSGVAQLEHFEGVSRSDDPDDLDSILRNRQIDNPTPEDLKLERVHTRIILKTYGKPLNMFDTRRELLLAFRDTVVAHRALHEVAGILHRDISMGNILINPGGAEGNRGILIDFDHAIRVGDTSPYSTKKRIGTWRYMSRNVLEGKGPHTYLDDLESFYFVLCWILMVYAGPHKVNHKPPEQAGFWDEPGSTSLKHGHFATIGHRIEVDPSFGPCFQVLANHLFHFFCVRCPRLGGDPPPLDPIKDYDEYLGYIRDCIDDMNAEDVAIEKHDTSLSDGPSRLGKRNREQVNESDGAQVPNSKRHRGLPPPSNGRALF